MRNTNGMAFLFLTLLVGVRAKNPDAESLGKTVVAQAKQIKMLEQQVSRLGRALNKKTGMVEGDFEDPEPELYAFRLAERQRRAAKKQDSLLTQFNITVNTTTHSVRT